MCKLDVQGKRIHITGIVQGVGFRPFVFDLAQRLGLTGWIRNTSAGVDIDVDGSPEHLTIFASALMDEAPPLAHIDEIQISKRKPDGFTSFDIVPSTSIPGAFQPISPDVSVCDDCLSELFDPEDRRHRYPFINCTNCGPRFTIIKDIPYDRPLTTMAPFEMCSACAAEYQDPANRRFHAQPVACHQCGPQVWLEDSGSNKKITRQEEAIQQARKRILQGQVVAIRGLGGFHLACDAANQAAVSLLRERKLRVDKPFALMMPSLDVVRKNACLSPAEQELLTSREKPIVILSRRPDSPLAANIAPGQNNIGVMLPYTPLHHLLLEPAAGFPEILVMTSGNLSEEPIATGVQEAIERLSNLADCFLFHDREIEIRCDDSVVRVFPIVAAKSEIRIQKKLKEIYPLRRARGYAPFPVRLPWRCPPILAGGAELKNSFCLTRDHYGILSHHIGDLENFETLTAFESGITHFEKLFRLKPEALAYDLHPNYLASRYILDRAKAEDIPAVGVQHHHAHIASAMAEHGFGGEEKVIGFSFDGTGYGPDGAIWGGEVLVSDYDGYDRAFHLDYTPLPGGDRAVREPWRFALAWLDKASIPWDEWIPSVVHGSSLTDPFLDPLELLRRQLDSGVNCLPTSSIGRLFDAAASLMGLRHKVNFEAQSAIELEAIVDKMELSAYTINLEGDLIDPRQMLADLLADVKNNVPLPVVAARFHNGLAQTVLEISQDIRRNSGLHQVVLSGGVWQNVALLARTIPLLKREGFEITIHRQVPANDGGLSLGQAVIAARHFQ